MEIYDSRYFIYNKRFQKVFGVWPYQNRLKNNLINALEISLFVGVTLPQIISVIRHLGTDLDKLMENVFALLYLFGTSIKLFTAKIAEDKIKILYETTAKNFQTITDQSERNILFKYSERGRLLTIGFIIYMITALIMFTSLPLIPIALDSINPLNQSRTRMFILNGDYLVDSYDHYMKIFMFESLVCVVTVLIMCSTDPMYAAIVEHCLGLFSIVKYRLKTYDKFRKIKDVQEEYASTQGDYRVYRALVQTIQLHKEIIRFAKIIETSYSLYFFLEMGASMFIITAISVIIVIKLGNTLEVIRYVLVLIGILLHLFFLTWPGQKLIDYSGDIFQDTYHNEWYENSIRCQNLLKFMSLRCSIPCQLSGCGLYVMNFINFAMVICNACLRPSFFTYAHLCDATVSYFSLFSDIGIHNKYYN